MQTEATQKYFRDFEEQVRKVYAIAKEAREKGLDPVRKVEIPLAKTMAEKCVELIGTIYPQMSGCGIDDRMLELEKEYGKLDPTVVFKIAEEVAKQKFCKFDSLLEAIDAGIRLGFAYQTIGVVASPIEGYTHLELGKTREGKDYFKAYFSGPIRSAGTTASCIVLMLIDYLRELFGYARYDPTEDEIKRYATENTDYHERVTNLQYFPLEEEMKFLASKIPIQICGDPTEKFEVSNYKNLERVETNFIRGGMCLIFSEGLAQKAAKGFRLYNRAKDNGVQMTGFDWIPEYLELHEKLTSGAEKTKGDGVPVYIKDLVAGRPVFGHPSKSGAFRFRYGRGRTSGFSAASVHPATMAITDDFIAIGTQLKIEKPTKGMVTTSCDIIEGPIVKLFNGSVRKIKDAEEAKRIYSDVEEIIYLGDLLFPFSDLANRNADLIKPGYVEEWWGLDLMKENPKIAESVNVFDVSLETALKISRENNVPLHPSHIFYWTQISKDEFMNLVRWIKNSKGNKKIILPYYKTIQEKYAQGKRALELLGVEHERAIEHVIIDEDISRALLTNLGMDYRVLDSEILFSDLIDEDLFNQDKSVLEIINTVSKFKI